MVETFELYNDNLRSTFHDFLNHELIAKDPYTLSEEEIWDGIKGRSNNRPKHRCDLINRMNRYCTLVTINGHVQREWNGRCPQYGIFNYTFNKSTILEVAYSTFKYAHNFSDQGMVCSSFGDSQSFRLTVDIIIDGKRQSCWINEPDGIFENSVNVGSNIFLEYSIEGKNSFNSIKSVPYFVNIDDSDAGFIDEVRKSLLKTKYFLLSLVDKYPSHLMHEIANFNKYHKEFKDYFLKLYADEMQFKIAQLKDATSRAIFARYISVNSPF